MFDLGRSFLASVERSPDAVAIVDGDHRLTYATAVLDPSYPAYALDLWVHHWRPSCPSRWCSCGLRRQYIIISARHDSPPRIAVAVGRHARQRIAVRVVP